MLRLSRVLFGGRTAAPASIPPLPSVQSGGLRASAHQALLMLGLALWGCGGYEFAPLDARLCSVGFNEAQRTALEGAITTWNDTGVTSLSLVDEGTPGCIPIYARPGGTAMAAAWGDIGHSVSGMTAPDASRIDLLVESPWTDEDHELKSVAMHELCHLLSGPDHTHDEKDLMFRRQNNVTVLSEYDISRVANR